MEIPQFAVNCALVARLICFSGYIKFYLSLATNKLMIIELVGITTCQAAHAVDPDIASTPFDTVDLDNTCCRRLCAAVVIGCDHY